MQALVCEDDPSIRALVQTIVRREGFDVNLAPVCMVLPKPFDINKLSAVVHDCARDCHKS